MKCCLQEYTQKVKNTTVHGVGTSTWVLEKMFRKGYSVQLSKISNDTQQLVTCGSYLYKLFMVLTTVMRCTKDNHKM